MFDLSGKCALITGASGGIGGAVATALHGRGATVALSGTRIEALESLARGLGDRAFVTPCDLSDRAKVAALPDQAAEAMGQVDILVNNAGLTRDGLAIKMTDEDWDQVIEINLTAAFALARKVLRPMMKRRWGRIIGISSVIGVTGNAGQSNYAASKAGMIGVTKSLAQEVASRGITVNCIAPGFITTPMTNDLNDRITESLVARIPARKFGEPGDIGASVVFLASEEAGYITGQTLHVNGGMAMI